MMVTRTEINTLLLLDRMCVRSNSNNTLLCLHCTRWHTLFMCVLMLICCRVGGTLT